MDWTGPDRGLLIGETSWPTSTTSSRSSTRTAKQGPTRSAPRGYLQPAGRIEWDPDLVRLEVDVARSDGEGLGDAAPGHRESLGGGFRVRAHRGEEAVALAGGEVLAAALVDQGEVRDVVHATAGGSRA